MINYTWKKKQPMANYFGIVERIVCELEGIKDGITASANTVTVFPENEQEHADDWTQDRIDAFAESCREKCNMDAEVERRISIPSDDWTKDAIKAYMDGKEIDYLASDSKNDLLVKVESPPIPEVEEEAVEEAE